MKIQSNMKSEIKLPFLTIHSVMLLQGFRRIRFRRRPAYRARFDDASTRRSYLFTIPVRDHGTVVCSVKVAEAFFEDYDSIPIEIAKAAESKVREISDYLSDEKEKQSRFGAKKPVQSGVMAPHMEDIVLLGKQMEGMKTNRELLEQGMIPDPIQ